MRGRAVAGFGLLAVLLVGAIVGPPSCGGADDLPRTVDAERPEQAPLPALPRSPTGVEAHEVPCRGPEGRIGVTLVGPGGAPEPLAVVVFVPGSQAMDRRGDAPGRPWGHMFDLAVGVAEGGYRAVIYDKAGTGVSEGSAGGLRERVEELQAVLGCIDTSPLVAGQPRVLAGFGQGASVAVRALQQGTSAAGLALLSPLVEPTALAAIPVLPVTVVRGGLDGGAAADQGLRAVLGARGLRTIYTEVPGADHLLLDLRSGLADPADPDVRVSPVAIRALLRGVQASVP